ncbi:cytochrome c family protein [Pseudoruegeria sp. SK021]|uniref:c-type cytochrome n=1 Tax=Pseudoruegeria sp. SK021 TaxID=1933035 RepID=UPI000A261E57|nr:c-type cytochrome [Pseudoruegeria sp. SK021]OSP54193.1 cytochrome C [Pseudoruegeria sp. SK021]
MKCLASAILGLSLIAIPLFTGAAVAADAAAGEKTFSKCKACHAVVADDGTVIYKGGRTGPNLYGVDGRAAGSVEGFRYGRSMDEAGAAGLVWTEETFSGYLADPKAYLGSYLDTKSVQAKMVFKLPKPEDAADVWAYLVSVGPTAD